MGFVSDFAQGFFTTSANTILDRKKRQDEIDDARKKAIALAEPEIEVFKRKTQIQAEADRQAQREANDRFLDFINKQGSGTQPTPAATQPDFMGTLSQPTGTQQPGSTPSSSPVNFVPGGTSTPSSAPTTDLGAINDKLQQAIQFKAAAAGSGNKQLESYFDTQVELYKQQYTYAADNAKALSKPVTSSEGTNIVDQIQKDSATKLKDPAKYQSDYLPAKINGLLIQSDIQQVQEDSTVKHAALAQAVANAIKRANPALSTEEAYPLIREQTKKAVVALNTINSTDARITEGDKKQAVLTFEKILNTITKNDSTVLEALKNDPNYAAIFDELTTTNIETLVGTAAPTAAPEAATSNPILDAARDAIQRGAPRDKVIQRLIENNIDPTGL